MEIGELVLKYLPIVSIVSTIIIAFVGAAWAVHKFNKQNSVNSVLQKEKAELDEKVNTVIKKQEFENERKLTEFSLYANKKHEKYIDLFEAMAEAVNIINRITNTFKQIRSFEDFGKLDIEIFLEATNITHLEKDLIIETWEFNHQEGIRKLQGLDMRIELFNAMNTTNNARIACMKASLYMPQNLYEEIRDFTYDIWSLARTVKYYTELQEQHTLAINDDSINELKQRPERARLLNERFELLTKKLQKELCD